MTSEPTAAEIEAAAGVILAAVRQLEDSEPSAGVRAILRRIASGAEATRDGCTDLRAYKPPGK